MKTELEQLLAGALRALPEGTLNGPVAAEQIAVERTRDAQHGDYACNIALRLAKSAARKPRELAELIVAALPANDLVRKAEVAGAGFINFYLASDAQTSALQRVLAMGAQYGTDTIGAGQGVLLEFVSANPTGPLHVGHGRQAAWGSTLANLLRATGHRVHREYYINDAGRQVDILTVSVWIRYLQLCGESLPFPENGYRGAYVNDIAKALHAARGDALHSTASAVTAALPSDAPAGDKEQYIDALIERMRQLQGAIHFDAVTRFALDGMLADIRADLAEFGVEFDQWYSERSLSANGAIERALARLESQQQLYRKDGATWFRSSTFGDDEDRVLVRSNGQHTYFAPDLAYHLDKRQRGYRQLIDVWGADHHGYVPRMRGGLVAMGEPAECFEVCLIQFVSLFRGEVKVPMGKRDGQFVTLRQLRAEVGNDACRFFYLMRSHDQHLDFDLELAKTRSNDNPVYYIQYAHARVASVMQQLSARELHYDQAQGLAQAALLSSPHEQAMLTAIGRYPEVVRHAALHRTPHSLVHFLRDAANAFHSWYNASQFIVEEATLRNARLALAVGAQQMIRNGLQMLGVSAPESM
jgi:arginyl-tRNA synthetase